MSADILNFPGVTRLDLPAATIIAEALESDFESVVIMGYTADHEEYFASSVADGGTVLWLLERMKLKLLRYADKPED